MKTERIILVVLVVLMSSPLMTAADQPVKLDPVNPHYLHFRGRPIVVVTSAEHYGAVLNLDFDYVKYLDALAADNLNYTRIFTGSYVEPAGAFGIRNNTLAPAPGRFMPPWARSGKPGYSNGGNKFDLENWNPEYFQRLRSFVTEAGKRNILVEVTLFCSVYSDAQWGLNPFNPVNNVNQITLPDRLAVNTLDNGNILRYQEQLTRKIVQELQEFDNVIYEIQNEPYADLKVTSLIINPYLPGRCVEEWQNRVDLANEASLAWQKRIAEVIADEESKLGTRHLIAQNVANFHFPVKDLAPGISVVNFHYAYPEAVLSNHGLNLAIGYDESGFLPQSDFVYRQQAWNFLLGGGAIFNNLDYSFVCGHESGDFDDIQAPGWGSPALRKQLGVLKSFLESSDFVRMNPSSDLIVSAPGISARALAWTGRQYAVYLAGRGPAILELNLPRGDFNVHWISTTDGVELKSETVKHRGGPVSVSSPPFEEDIALRIVSVVGRL